MTEKFQNNSLGRRAWRKLKTQKFTMLCFTVIAAYLLIALIGALGLLPDHRIEIGPSYTAPAWGFAGILGTDFFGYSVLYKILAGTQTAMAIGFLTTAIVIPLGVIIGAIAGYYGGWIDDLVVFLCTVVNSVPYILMVIAIAYLLGKGLESMCVAMGVVGWVPLSRLIRAEFMKHKEREYVLASRLLGANDFLLIFKHILPNVFHLAIITASLTVLSAIKSEVILTYLGVGITDGSSWGSMIQAAEKELVTGVWWPLAGVVLAMFFIIYALNVAGDALRDALDPKLVD